MWRRLKQLFDQVERSTVGVPATHVVLERTPEEDSRRTAWQNSPSASATLQFIDSNFHAYRGGLKTDRSIAFLHTESKKGFVLYLTDQNPTLSEPTFIMDMLRDKIIQLGYISYTSDIKVYSHQHDVETLQRHYLKPPLNFSESKKLSQAFGNISIEYIMRNDKPYLLKFSATVYKDHMFLEADGFDDLMEHLITA